MGKPFDDFIKEIADKYGNEVAVYTAVYIAVKVTPIVCEALHDYYEQVRISKKHKPNGAQGR